MILYIRTRKFQSGGKTPNKVEAQWAPDSYIPSDDETTDTPSRWSPANIQRSKAKGEKLMRNQQQRLSDQGMRNYYNNYTPTYGRSTPQSAPQQPAATTQGGQSNFVNDMYGMSEYDRNSYLYGSKIHPSYRDVLASPGTAEWYNRMNDPGRSEEDRAMYRRRLQSLNDKIMATGFEPTPY